MIELEYNNERGAKLRVVGVGGGGGNCVNNMIEKGMRGVEFITMNTDSQALENSKASRKVQIGKSLTRGLGAGADPSIGQRAAEEDREDIARSIEGCDMVFITAGMGGGTGTGAAPVIANIAKSAGALVVAIVTKPFSSEGKRRMFQAETGIAELKKHVDTLIVVPNQKLLSLVDKTTPLREALNRANDVLYNATRGISEVITIPGFINVDFADVRTVMKESGDALMGAGIATGEHRAIEAAHAAISSPLLDDISISGARGVLINVTGGNSMTLMEVDEVANVIHESTGDDANVILGAVIDENAGEELRVTVIATGFNKKNGAMNKKSVANYLEPFPVGISEKNALDEPAFVRKGIAVSGVTVLDTLPLTKNKIDKRDADKPAFLRRIMD
ncbi:MAG: cell division protein FtsZ [Ignavibacteria bacterium]|nr:cell division protein FtsZ [Ignavibacteria bacterium]